MNFGLDYDGTASEDINLWIMFIMLAKVNGHKVYLVTMRYESEINDPNFPNKAIPDHLLSKVDGVICTNRQAKRKAVEALGIRINVWIDDHPRAVEENATQIWGWCTPEGVIVKNLEEAEEQRSKGQIPQCNKEDSTKVVVPANQITGTVMTVNAFKAMLPEEQPLEDLSTEDKQQIEKLNSFIKSVGLEGLV
jgi:hypothetical protein